MSEENPQQPQGEKNKTPISPLRTYESDIHDTIRDENLSLAKMALAERQKHGEIEDIESLIKHRSKRRLIIYLVILISLLLSGLSSLSYYLIFIPKNDRIGTDTAKPPAFIVADKEEEISLGGSKLSSLVDIVQKEIGSPLIISNVKVIHLKDILQKFVTTKGFLKVIGANMPSALERSLDNYLTIGIHAFDGNHPFLVFKTNSFENAFTGMINWESDMAEKLIPVFTGRSLQESEKNPFEDVIIKNKDARVLNDADGRPLIIYAFLDRETFVITDNEYTLEEVSKRLTALKLKH